VEGETAYTVDEAAALLEETPERVLEMLSSGDLDGIPPGGAPYRESGKAMQHRS
jgi:hypothetical protein